MHAFIHSFDSDRYGQFFVYTSLSAMFIFGARNLLQDALWNEKLAPDFWIYGAAYVTDLRNRDDKNFYMPAECSEKREKNEYILSSCNGNATATRHRERKDCISRLMPVALFCTLHFFSFL